MRIICGVIRAASGQGLESLDQTSILNWVKSLDCDDRCKRFLWRGLSQFASSFRNHADDEEYLMKKLHHISSTSRIPFHHVGEEVHVFYLNVPGAFDGKEPTFIWDVHGRNAGIGNLWDYTHNHAAHEDWT